MFHVKHREAMEVVGYVDKRLGGNETLKMPGGYEQVVKADFSGEILSTAQYTPVDNLWIS